MIKYFNSGIYNESFYVRHFDKENYMDAITYCETSDYAYEKTREDFLYESGFGTYDEVRAQITNERLESLEEESKQEEEGFAQNYSEDYFTYFEPMIFNKEIALECGLKTVIYKGVEMLGSVNISNATI